MPKRPKPEFIDSENPEWTADDVARARPAREVLPGLFGAKTAAATVKPRGRPLAAVTKERITIRLSPEVLRVFREGGAGWQTRLDAVLKNWVTRRAKR